MQVAQTDSKSQPKQSDGEIFSRKTIFHAFSLTNIKLLLTVPIVNPKSKLSRGDHHLGHGAGNKDTQKLYMDCWVVQTLLVAHNHGRDVTGTGIILVFVT